MKLGSWEPKEAQKDMNAESPASTESRRRSLHGSLLHKICFTVLFLGFYVCLVSAVSYISKYTLDFVEEEKRAELDWMWWCLVRTTFLVDIFCCFCFPNSYTVRPLPSVINFGGMVAIATHVAVVVARIVYYVTLEPHDFLVYVAANVVVFVILTFRQFYVCCFYIFSFEPYQRNDDLRRDYTLTATTGSVRVVSSGAFEIVLRNDGNENWCGKKFTLKRMAKSGFRARTTVSFGIPESVVLKPSESVKLIPETEPISPGKVHIRGFRCFGYDSEDVIATQVILKSTPIAETLEKYREIGKVWSDSGKLAAKIVKKCNWNRIEMTTYDETGRYENSTIIM